MAGDVDAGEAGGGSSTRSGASAPGGTSRPRRRPLRPSAATVRAVAAILVTLAIVFGLSLQAGSSRTSQWTAAPGASPAAGVAGRSPGSGASPTAGTSPAADTAPATAWARLAVQPYTPIATLVPTIADAGGVAADSAFRLTSRTSQSPDTLAARITVDPPLQLTVDAATAGAVLRPARPLTPGQVYRFTLRAPDGSLQGSWAFQVKEPLHVVATLPADESTNVPVDTGIEITFDQGSTSRAQDYVSIAPRVDGRFEWHGRTLAFVPSSLTPRTVYTVTVRHGLPIDGSDQVLEADEVFAFETAGPGGNDRVQVTFAGRVFESSTSEKPVLTLYSSGKGAQKAVVTVYRFADMGAALAALHAVEAAPTWTMWQPTAGLVPTQSLVTVTTFTAAMPELGAGDGRLWFRLPAMLPAGWYLVSTAPTGAETQAFLQVTDVATYVSATSTDAVAWVHDLAAKAPLAGATLALEGSTASLGTTDSQGLLVTPSPADLVVSSEQPWSRPAGPRSALIVTAPDGRQAFVAGSMWNSGGPSEWSYRSTYGGLISCYGSCPDWQTSQRYWRLLYLDRTVYRQTDTINAWGFVRRRDTDQVPADLAVRVLVRSDDSAAAPPIAEVRPAASAAGAFSLSIPLRGVPVGDYEMQVWSGGVRIVDRWFTVDVIRKPAYTLSAATGRRHYVAGETIPVAVHAAFYDGTPVPNVGLEVDWNDQTRRLVTDDAGDALTAITGVPDEEGRQVSGYWFSISPTRSEEGDISANTQADVYAARVYLDGDATLEGGRLAVAGTVHQLDLAKADATGDPRGAPVGDVTVTARIVAHVPVRTRTGETYDFIAKKVVPTYSYDVDDVTEGTLEVASAGDGSFSFERTVTRSGAWYTVQLSASDAGGRRTSIEADAGEPPRVTSLQPYLAIDGPVRGDASEASSGCGPSYGSARYRVGDTVRLAMSDGRGVLPSGGANEYLFLSEQLGLRSVIAQRSARLQLGYGPAAPPDLVVSAVRFTGVSYQAVTDGFVARFDTSQREVSVSLTPDASAYRPGDTVTLRVRTTSADDGRPIAATVTLSAVDQKLYDAGAAEEGSPLADLYVDVASGLGLTYSSHQYPTYEMAPGCGGAGGTQETRSEFRDNVLYRQISTDASGAATVTFTLSDDLTSWHVAADAITPDLRAGSSWIGIPVGLPFFVDATVAPQYLASDRPTIRLRAFGTALQKGDPVAFTVASDTLGMAPLTVRGTAFGDVSVALPGLALGTQELRITASAGTSARPLRDAVTRTFTVVPSRLLRNVSSADPLGPGFQPQGGAGLTRYVFADAGRGRFLGTLQALAWSDGARVDESLGAWQARALLTRYFPGVPNDAPPSSFDPSSYLHWTDPPGGEAVGLLPYASGDLAPTVQALMAAPDAFGSSPRQYLMGVANAADSTAERRAIALAGLALLGEPLLAELQAAARGQGADPTTRLHIALGLEALGDDGSAAAIERDLLATYGERFGSMVRLAVPGSGSAISEATALLAVVAAGLGDPVGEAAEAYVEENPSAETLTNLQQLAYIERAIERAPSTPASVAYTVDGTRRVASLGPGEAAVVTLTPPQRGSFTAETLSGQVVVTTSWAAPFDPTTARLDPTLAVARRVTPEGDLEDGELVQVTFDVGLPATAVSGCYQLRETVPSGLVPLTIPRGFDQEPTFAWPYLIQAQELDFCVTPGQEHPPGYLARVMTGGTYAWEPAVLQPTAAAERIAVTAPASVTIR